MRRLDRKRLKKASEVGFAIIAGNMLLGFAVAAFILPSGVIMGGATGVGVVLARFIPLDTALIVLCVNLLALALGWAVLGWRFVLATVASSLLYPIFLGAAQRVPGIEGLTADPLLSALLGGVLCVIPPRKLYAAQSLIQSVDPHAFLTITQIREVRGQGFSSERVYVEPPESPIE